VRIFSTAARRLTAGGLVVGMAVAGAAYAAPASADGSIDVDATSTYSCDVWIGANQVPTDPNVKPTLSALPVTSELKMTLPDTVKQGDTIPSTSVSVTNDMTPLLGLAQLVGKYASGASPDVALNLLINNQSTSAPLVGVAADWAPIPAPPSTGPWPIAATGTSTQIDVPQDATGDIVVSGPQQFSIISQVSQTSDGANPIPSAILCQATPGEDLTLARMNVTPVSTPTMTVTPPASSVYGADVTVPVSIAVPAGGIQPTGTVLLSTPGRVGSPGTGLAQADIDSSGNANVIIAGTALPAGTNTVTVTYAGDSNTRPATTTVSITKTKATPGLAATVRPGKVVAGEISPSVNVRLTGPGGQLGGPFTVVADRQIRHGQLDGDGRGTVQLNPFATAGAKSVVVLFAGNTDFKPVTATVPVQVVKDKLSIFTAKTGPATVNVTRPVLAVKLAAAGPASGMVTVRTAGHVIGSAMVHGSGDIALNRFRSVGTKTLRVRFAGTNSIAAKTITVPLTVKKANLDTFAANASPAKIVAKKTHAVLKVTLAAPALTGHGVVAVKLGAKTLAKSFINGTGNITLPMFATAGQKALKLVFAGNSVVNSDTIGRTVTVVRG
jgi:hypothetical protein